MLEVRILTGDEAIRALSSGAVTNLTEAATGATFDSEDLTGEQRVANRRVVDISEATAQAAAANAHQHLAAAFVDGRFAGFVIATKHAPGDHELDWLMVHPDFHGTNVADALMRAGMAWLGENEPMWLNVIRHNARAIRFYEKRGFKVDPMATTAHVVPHHVMRRQPAARC
jgi:ribosomal protein S18 acetylase RimI-like enzyme